MKLYKYSDRLLVRKYFQMDIFFEMHYKLKLKLRKNKIWDINFKEIIWKISRTNQYLVKVLLKKRIKWHFFIYCIINVIKYTENSLLNFNVCQTVLEIQLRK